MRHAKLLIVDDVEANIISLEYLLNDYFEDIDIVSVNNGEDALKVAFTQNINLIILDIQMPNMDGFEVAKFLKLNPKTKNIPIIFLTAAFKEEKFQEKGFSIGAIDYLTKPINNNQFINKLKLYMEIFNKNIKLQDMLKENKKQKKVLQSILDTQENLIIVTDFTQISFINKAFLDFLGVASLKDFVEKKQCFLDMLLNEPNAISYNKIASDSSKGREFYEKIQNINETDRVVYIKNSLNIKNSFFISMSITDDESDIYLISLTNITKMRENQLEITQKAFYDGLTGVYNRNKFNDILTADIEKAYKDNSSFSCVLIDIDHFKRFNDTYGHLIGDEVLILLAESISENIRKKDFFARWGGEEFVILLSNTQVEEAILMTEQLRKNIEKINHKTAGHISASFGVTQYIHGDNIETLFKRCDDALYEAKNNGRNCVKSK